MPALASRRFRRRPPAIPFRRLPAISPIVRKPRGVIVQIMDRFVEARLRRTITSLPAPQATSLRIGPEACFQSTLRRAEATQAIHRTHEFLTVIPGRAAWRGARNPYSRLWAARISGSTLAHCPGMTERARLKRLNAVSLQPALRNSRLRHISIRRCSLHRHHGAKRRKKKRHRRLPRARAGAGAASPDRGMEQPAVAQCRLKRNSVQTFSLALSVIPGRCASVEPGIHNHDREYGFRARAKRRAPE